MRLLAASLLILLVVLATGCMVPEQSGETPGGPIVLHYETSFNRVLLYGRPAGILLLGLFVGIPGRKNRVALAVALVLGVSALLVLQRGRTRVNGFRIESDDQALLLCLPPEEPREIEWKSVVGMDLEGYRHQDFVRPAGFEHAEDWRKLEIKLKGGERIVLDLSPFAVGQRHVLQRSIRAHAHLTQAASGAERPWDDWRNALPDVVAGAR